MKVGIDCRLIDKQQNTGISRYSEFLLDYYIARYGIQNLVLISNNIHFKYKNCTIVHTIYKPFNLFHFLFYSYFIENLELDIFHIPFYSGFFLKTKKLKLIVTVHDLMYQFVENFFGNSFVLNFLKKKYFDFIVGNTLKNADIIVSVSKTTQSDVLKLYNKDSICIPEDSEISAPSDFTILNKHNLRNKGFFFYCGNNRPHKNIDFIIDVFSTNLQLPTLVLAGKGHRNYNNVISVGLVSDSELNALYKSSIAFIFPSKYEGFGLPVIEALRMGTFVIASNIPVFLEFKSSNILFFDLCNKFEFLNVINNAISREFVSENSFLSKYEKNSIYELYDSLIYKLINIK